MLRLRRILTALPRRLPALLFLCALLAFIAGHAFTRLRLGDNRLSIIFATDPSTLGLRFYFDPHAAHDPHSGPWLRLFRAPPLPPSVDQFPPPWDLRYPNDWSIDRGLAWSPVPRSLEFAIGSASSATSTPSSPSAFFLLPHALTLSATALLLLAQLLLQFRSFRRHPSHPLCPNCRYDLRTSPLRCPECGTPTPTFTSPPIPFPLRLPLSFDRLLLQHPLTTLAALFLLTLTASITFSPITPAPSPQSPAPLLSFADTPPTLPITRLYPIDTLLTSPTSPFTGTPNDRFQQLSDRITDIDSLSWATHGGDRPSPYLLQHLLLLTAPPPIQTQVESLLTHLAAPPTPQ